MAEAGQEGHEGRRFDQSTAEGIGDDDVALADGFDEAGDAEQGVTAEFEGVAVGIVLAADDEVDGFEAGERFEVDAIIADGEVSTFDEGQAPEARQVGVFEVGFVVRAGGEDDGAAFAGGQGEQAIAPILEEAAELADGAVVENVGECAGADEAIFERVAGAGGRLGAIGNDPPLAIGRAGEVDGVAVEPDLAGHIDAVAGPEKARVGEDEFRRQGAVLQQLLFAVDIAEDPVEQVGALRDAGFDLVPLFFADHHGQRIHGPGALAAFGVAIDVVGDAVGLDEQLAAAPAAIELGAAHAGDGGGEFAPMAARKAGGLEGLIPVAGHSVVTPVCRPAEAGGGGYGGDAQRTGNPNALWYTDCGGVWFYSAEWYALGRSYLDASLMGPHPDRMLRFVLLWGLVCAGVFATPLYHVRVIPTPAGPFTGLDGWAINEAGVIAGLTKGTNAIFTGTPDGSQVLPGTSSGIRFDINSSNVVANGNITTSLLNGILSLGGDAFVSSLNDAGTVAGANSAGAAVWDAFGNPTNVPTPVGMTNSFIQDINNAGQLVGVGLLGGSFVPFFGTAAGVTVIPLPGLGQTGITRINQNGDILGASNGGTWMLPNGGALILLPAAASTPTGLNNHRQAVGRLGGFGGWIWDEVNGLRNLDSLLPAGWRLVSAEGINDAGQIVAQALDSNNNFLTVRLDPAPEPATVMLVAAGLSFAVRLRRRR